MNKRVLVMLMCTLLTACSSNPTATSNIGVAPIVVGIVGVLVMVVSAYSESEWAVLGVTGGGCVCLIAVAIAGNQIFSVSW